MKQQIVYQEIFLVVKCLNKYLSCSLLIMKSVQNKLHVTYWEGGKVVYHYRITVCILYNWDLMDSLWKGHSLSVNNYWNVDYFAIPPSPLLEIRKNVIFLSASFLRGGCNWNSKLTAIFFLYWMMEKGGGRRCTCRQCNIFCRTVKNKYLHF